MTGRTNVGGGGTALNADVEPKIVKSGNITAGDFVEYYTESKWIEPSGVITFKFCIGEYTVGMSSRSVILLKGNEQISSYNDDQIYEINKYNNMITFLASNSSYGVYKIGVLKIVNDQLVLVSSQETTGISRSSSVEMQSSHCAGNGKVLFLKISESSSSRTINQGYAFDISEEGILSNGVKTNNINASWGEYLDDIVIVFCNDNFYSHSVGTTRGTGRNHKFIIGQNNAITYEAGSYEPQLSSVYNEMARLGRKIIYSGSNSSGIKVYDVISTNYSILAIDGYIAGIIDGGLFVAYKNINLESNRYEVKVRLYRYDEQANNVTLINEMTLDYPYYLYQTIIPGTNATANNVYVQLYADETGNNTYKYNIRLLEIFNGILQDIHDNNFVIPYQNGNRPIGVAKDSGRTNDIIDVYVPTPIS